MQPEVHFVLFEAVSDRYELGFKVIKKVIMKFWRPSLEFENWVITDFDNALNGNPHIIDDEEVDWMGRPLNKK